MSEREPYDGHPYYCIECDAGYREYLACKMDACELENKRTAEARARLHKPTVGMEEVTMPNYDPNSDDYHYPPRHEPDAEIDRLRVELRDWQASSEAYRHDAERAEARVVELEALCKAQHGAVARAERAEAERDAEMERVKACEHIADGDDGWEKVRNLCPSTAAVARLRDRYAAKDARIVSHEEGARMIQEPEPNDGVVVHEDGSVSPPAGRIPA